MFMGTPEIAIPALEILHKKHEICAIVTQADKPRGRGHKLTPTPVALWGEAHNIPVIKPATLVGDTALGRPCIEGNSPDIVGYAVPGVPSSKDNPNSVGANSVRPHFEEQHSNQPFLPNIQQYAPDIIVVVAYGKILPKYILDFPQKCINIHFSLLPKYRGAAPVQRAIQNGEVETGVCSMLMDEGLDTGDILHTIKTPILEGETSGELFNRLAFIGAECVDYTLDNLESIIPLQQDDESATYAPMLTKQESFIDFEKAPKEIINHIRAFNPHPVARMYHGDDILKVFSAQINNDNELQILEVQPPNKAKMLYSDFLRGKKSSG